VRGSAPIEGPDDSHTTSVGEPATTNTPSLRVVRAEQHTSDQASSPATASEVDVELLERRRYLVGVREKTLNERLAELDRREMNLVEREAALSLREAEHEIATAFEKEALALREQQLNELADRLERKEAQVADYVVQAQRKLARAATPAPDPSPQSRRSWLRHR
jgi:hypothetical protein